MTSKAVFTLALGKPIYLKMAVALARSFNLWHQKSDIKFTIVTDKPLSDRPGDLGSIDWMQVPSEKYGVGFTPKLYLDELAPAEKSLFVDADCLVVRSLEDVFKRFSGRKVSVVGTNWSEGEWFGDVRKIASKVGVPHYPYLNGGIYYIEPGETATRVFEKARELRLSYDDLGIERLRGGENDEPLISLAMAFYGQEPVPEDGTIMNTLMDAVGGLKLNVLAGVATLKNPQDHPNRARGHSIPILRPAIMHLNSIDIATHPYRTEALRLKLVSEKGWPPSLAFGLTAILYGFPAILKKNIKQVLRPIFHRIFGPRAIKETVRQMSQ